MRKIEYPSVLTSNASFGLVRTNPKLTGNVKITINESGQFWLNSIDANLELAKDSYKKFAIDPTHSHAANLCNFFKGGSTPNEIIFDLNEKVDVTKTSNNYKDQYDFSNYFSGVKYFPSKKYSERLSYFAPIYLKKDLPKYFIILKLKDPINKPINESEDDYNNDISNYEYLKETFINSTIIKTFDISENQVFGKYIRAYLAQSTFPVSPLTVSYEDGGYTYWNGVLIKDGVLGSKGEQLHSFYKQANPIKFFEQNITLGFQRNGVIFPNILNLEFIFNDDTSDNYDFNRYVGFYVNDIELAKLQLDLNRSDIVNSPLLKRQYLESDDKVVIDSNSTGVILPYKDININLQEFDLKFKNSENLYFNYIKDKDGKLILPKLDETFNQDWSTSNVTLTYNLGIVTCSGTSHGLKTGDLVKIINTSDSSYGGDFYITVLDDNQFTYELLVTPSSLIDFGQVTSERPTGKITIANTKYDLGKLFGPGPDFLQAKGYSSEVKGYSFIAINILTEFNHLNEIKIYHPNGTRQDSNGKYELLTGVLNYLECPNSGDSYSYIDWDNIAGHDTFYFNGSGKPFEIANAIVECINNFRKIAFTAYAFNDWIFIKLNMPGDFDIRHSVSYNSISNQYDCITIGGLSEAQLINTLVNFNGGSNYSGNRLVLDGGHLSKILANFDDILVKTNLGWSKIKKVSQYCDEILESNQVSELSKKQAIDSYNNNIVVILTDDEEPSIRYGEFLMKTKYKPAFGLLSFFPLKDLDFDFLSSQYNDFPKIDLYQNYYIPSEVNLLEPGIEYTISNGTINVNGTQYTSTFTPTQLSKYSVVNGSPLVRVSDVDKWIGQHDANKELEQFSGFAKLTDTSIITPDDNTGPYIYRDKYFNGLANSEYDIYKENESTDFATRSKVIPYITKWAIKEGFDSRLNPYRLNSELLFTRNNFSPDHEDRTQNPNNFTHEWFFMESAFNYLNDKETLKSNKHYFETSLDLNKLVSDSEYFIDYFTYSPTFNDIEVGPTQFRYSNLYKNINGSWEAFFKGFKIKFKDLVNTLSNGPLIERNQTDRFDGYKFSCVVKPIKEDFLNKDVPPVKYRIIEHKEFKFIVVVIEIAIGHRDMINSYWQNANTIINIDNTNFNQYIPGSPSDFLYSSVNGEYRLIFNSANDPVSNLNYASLYSLKNKKFNKDTNNFSTVKLSSDPILDSVTYPTIKTKEHLAKYKTVVSDEIVKSTPSTFLTLYNLSSGSTYFLDTANGVVPNKTSPITGALSELIVYRKATSSFNLCLTSVDSNNITSLAYNVPTYIIENDTIFSMLTGGEKYYEKLFEKLSFASFKKLINTPPTSINTKYPIEYESWESSTVKSTSINYCIEILDVDTIEKDSVLITNLDSSKPTQYSFTKEIGYTYERGTLNVPFDLNRYRGNYEPLNKDLLFYNSSFKFTKNQISELKLSNISLNVDIDSLLVMTNFNHIKVSDSKILQLESDPSYLPVYPKIGEVAIGSSDYYLLDSNWDFGFHKKYIDKFTWTGDSGTLRVEEDDSFIGKILNVPAQINLIDFEITKLGEFEYLNTINVNDVKFVIKETDTTLDGIINLNNILTDYFISNGIQAKFDEYLVNDPKYLGKFNSIEEYTREYIKLNILKLYDLDYPDFWVKENSSLVSSKITTGNIVNPIIFNSPGLGDFELIKQGYSISKSLKINKLDRLILKFSFTKKLNTGLQINPKLKIKFI